MVPVEKPGHWDIWRGYRNFRTFLREGREASRVSRWGDAGSFGTLDEIYVGGLIAVANGFGND